MEEADIVKVKLHEEAYRFNFFKAVHLLELYSGGHAPGTGLSPAQDPVHFSVRPGFKFPASDIQEINAKGNGSVPKMTVNFMGLVGPQGVLPDWYNSHAQSSNYRKDYAFTDFLDLFHHRLISLFYRAWKKYRLVENYRVDGTDPVSSVLASLVGAGERQRDADPAFFSHAMKRLVYFCGLVARTVPTVAAIESLVSHAVGAPVRVEQFVERIIPVHEQDRTRLGSKNATLKKDALCGARIRDASSFFRVHIGPLSWRRYLAFSPGNPHLEKIRQLITYLAGIEYEFELRLIIRGQEIPALRLGDGAAGPILGRTATLRRPHRPYRHDIDVPAKCRGAIRRAA